jgi:protein-S-isoprenylcysteine O-methyltransferase Ste14
VNAIAASVGFALLVLFLLLDGRRRVGAEARSTDAGAEDRGSSRRLGIVYGISTNVFIVSAVLGYLGILAMPIAIAWAGVATMLAGMALRSWSMAVLGAAYTRTLRTSAEQRITRDGPYRVVRHPGYAGSIIMWTGLALASGDLLGLLIVPLVVWAYVLRIAAEDQMLLARFGDEYAEYAREVRRVVPFVY